MTEREILSERLCLRPVSESDLEALHTLWTDEPVRRFLWDGEAIPRQQTRDIVEQNRSQFEQSGYGIWGVRRRGTDELVAFAGFWHFRDPPCLELLFGVASGHWGQGIATESAEAVIRHGFEDLGFEHIVASTDRVNTASENVLEKLGMDFQRRESVDGLDTVFYDLHRDRWSRGAQQA